MEYHIDCLRDLNCLGLKFDLTMPVSYRKYMIGELRQLHLDTVAWFNVYADAAVAQ